MRLPRLVVVFTLAFGITLALVVGQRLSDEAMAVLVGVVAGVAASIPASLVIFWIARSTLVSAARSSAAAARRATPADREQKVIVVATPPAYYPARHDASAGPFAWTAPLPVAQPRHFTIVGEEATLVEALTRGFEQSGM
jgi:hypothetical protein